MISIYHHFFRASLKAAIIVIPIFGCTWVFGVLAVNENTVVFAWIFTILNSLQVTVLAYLPYFHEMIFQGMFIMFFYVLRNDKV